MTQKGSEFLEQARLILRNSETLLDIAARPDLLENRLRLGATELVAATWLRPFMVRLKEAYPNMSVELTVDFSRHLDTELAANRLDLTIQSAPFAKPATGMIALGSYDYVWVANGAIAAQLQASDAVQDAAFVYPILTQARHTQAYLDLVDHFEKATAPDVRFVPSNSLSAAIHMAMDGLGVAVLPRAMISSQLLEGSLVAVPIDWTPRPLRFAARYHAGKASAFVQRAAEIAAECADAFDAG